MEKVGEVAKKAGAAAQNRLPPLLDDINLRGIYREPLLILPGEPGGPDDAPFTPNLYEGPRTKARKLHAFPRFGYTNDIASLVSFSNTGEVGGPVGGRVDGVLSDRNRTNATADASEFMEKKIPILTTKQYNKQDANDYIRGIAAAGILIVAIYLVWGMWLLSLRVGRMDCCFRACQRCSKSSFCKRRRAKPLAESHDEEEDNDDDDDDDEDDSPRGGECCCFTCHETLAAKGGCCARNVFCGWMAGRPPRFPTKESLKRERELREKRFVPESVRGGAKTVGMAARSVVQDAGSKVVGSVLVKRTGSTDREAVETDDAAVVEAETGMPAADIDDGAEEPLHGNEAAGEHGPVAGEKTATDQNTIVIDEDYLLQRQKNARRTMLALRIIFLLSSTLVIVFSIVLLVKGWQGVNGIVDGSKDTIALVEDRLASMMDDIERYMDQNEAMKEKRMAFINDTTSKISEVGSDSVETGRFGWCPASAQTEGDGKIDITISLSQLLLRGNLIKLALVDEAVDAAGKVGTLVENAQDAVQNIAGGVNASNVKEQVGNVVEGASGAVQDLAGGVNATEVAATVKEQGASLAAVEVERVFAGDFSGNVNVTNVKEQAGTLVENATNTAQNLVGGVKEQGASLLGDAADAVQDFVGDVNATETIAAVKERTVTVITFLDEMPVVQNVLGKVLGLKDLVADGKDGVDGRIALVVAKLKELVKKLVSRVPDAILDSDKGDDGQRLLQSTALNSFRESVVEKDGISYTVITLVDDISSPEDLIGDRLIFKGYDLTKLLTNNVTVTLDIPGLVDTITDTLNSTENYFVDIFSKLYAGAEKIHAQSQSAQETLDSILPYYYVAVVFVCFIILLTLLFMLGTILAWKNKQHWLFRLTEDRILCPVFILCGLFMWIFTTVFLALGVVSGDFCFETPNNQVNQILEQTLRKTSNIAFNFAYYYVNSCPGLYKPKLVEVTFKAITLARTGIGQFFALVESFGSGPLSRACGVEIDSSIDALQALAGAVRVHLASATEAVMSLASLLLCKSISPLYTALTYNVVCSDFINLIAPLLWSMFIISIFSMVMITTRVAWHEFLEDDAMEDPRQQGRGREKDDSVGGDGAFLGEDEENGDVGEDGGASLGEGEENGDVDEDGACLRQDEEKGCGENKDENDHRDGAVPEEDEKSGVGGEDGAVLGEEEVPSE